jgi:hypothetical protein
VVGPCGRPQHVLVHSLARHRPGPRVAPTCCAPFRASILFQAEATLQPRSERASATRCVRARCAYDRWHVRGCLGLGWTDAVSPGRCATCRPRAPRPLPRCGHEGTNRPNGTQADPREGEAETASDGSLGLRFNRQVGGGGNVGVLARARFAHCAARGWRKLGTRTAIAKIKRSVCSAALACAFCCLRVVCGFFGVAVHHERTPPARRNCFPARPRSVPCNAWPRSGPVDTSTRRTRREIFSCPQISRENQPGGPAGTLGQKEFLPRALPKRIFALTPGRRA